MSKPNVYDLEDDTILDYATAAGLYEKLATRWQENNVETIALSFVENLPGDWEHAARKLKESCEEWIATEAREAFAGGLAIPGYSDDEDEEYEREMRRTA